MDVVILAAWRGENSLTKTREIKLMVRGRGRD